MNKGSLEHCYMGGRSSCGHITDNSGMASIQSMTTLWERTVASDSGLFQLQYMDLSEFLTENGMTIHEAELSSQSSRCHSTSSCSSSSPSSASAASPTTLDILGAGNCLNQSSESSIEPSCSPTCPPLTAPPMNNDDDFQMTFDPNSAFEDPSSVLGQDDFDHENHCFSVEDLKPQPVSKKAQKILVPDNLKDEKYWSRRWKNNEAAKRSRDARRLKENQISVRAAFLERENAALRQEVANMRKELGRCRNILDKYEGHYDEQL